MSCNELQLICTSLVIRSLGFELVSVGGFAPAPYSTIPALFSVGGFAPCTIPAQCRRRRLRARALHHPLRHYVDPVTGAIDVACGGACSKSSSRMASGRKDGAR